MTTAPAEERSTVSRLVEPLTRPFRDAYHGFRGARAERAMERFEAPILEDFRRFYADLEDKDGIYYVYFSGGLLHWLKKCLEFVPEDVNAVLIGSHLSDEERRWVEETYDRPFHAIPQEIDDKTVWEMLMVVNQRNFGWLDVDCLVKNPELFEEMRQVPEDAAFNTVWLMADESGAAFPYMHFLFVNIDAVRDPRLEELGIGPGTYSYEGGELGRHAPYASTHVLTTAQRRVVDDILGPRGRRANTYLNDRYFFDTLQLFGMTVAHLGWRLNPVRQLGGRRDPDHNSTEVVHVNSVSYVNREDLDWGSLTYMQRGNFFIVLLADTLLLWDVCDDLPESYRREAERRPDKIERLGAGHEYPPERIKQGLLKHVGHAFHRSELENDDRWSFLVPEVIPPGVLAGEDGDAEAAGGGPGVSVESGAESAENEPVPA